MKEEMERTAAVEWSEAGRAPESGMWPTGFDEAKSLSDAEIMAVTEGLLFAAGDPLSPEDLSRISGFDLCKCREALEQLQLKYRRDSQSALQLRKLEERYCLTIKLEYLEFCARLFRPGQAAALSAAAYETLAAVLYNQPATRAQIEEVRGVNSDSLVNRLEERGFIEQCGVLEQPGRPALFQVTEKFLLEFGMESPSQLPPTELLMYESLRKIDDL